MLPHITIRQRQHRHATPLPAPYITPPLQRTATLDEFADYLRTVTNCDGRPFQPATVDTCVYAGRALDAWMSNANTKGDFSVVGTAKVVSPSDFASTAQFAAALWPSPAGTTRLPGRSTGSSPP